LGDDEVLDHQPVISSLSAILLNHSPTIAVPAVAKPSHTLTPIPKAHFPVAMIHCPAATAVLGIDDNAAHHNVIAVATVSHLIGSQSNDLGLVHTVLSISFRELILKYVKSDLVCSRSLPYDVFALSPMVFLHRSLRISLMLPKVLVRADHTLGSASQIFSFHFPSIDQIAPNIAITYE